MALIPAVEQTLYMMCFARQFGSASNVALACRACAEQIGCASNASLMHFASLCHAQVVILPSGAVEHRLYLLNGERPKARGSTGYGSMRSGPLLCGLHPPHASVPGRGKTRA